MYHPVIVKMVALEQYRRMHEEQLIAQAYNRAVRKPVNLFGWVRSRLPGFSPKQNERLVPADEISGSAETPC
jgi:hypothetical protein